MDNILELWEKAPNGEQLMKALQEEKERADQAAQPRSAIIDPYNTYGVSGTRARQSMVNFNLLRSMANVPPIAAILNTRLNQVARFSRRPRFDGDIGFQIIHKDKTTKMTDAQRKRAVEIEEFFLKTGNVKNRKRKDNFNTFLRKITRDTLVLDAMTFELVPNLKGELAELWAMDAATIELVANQPVGEGAEPPVYEPMTKGGFDLGADNIAYVQRVNGEIKAEYSEELLAYAIRNPRTDILTADFGQSELEVLIEIVTGILNGIRYNTSYFTHNHIPQGVLEIVGKYKDEHLESFKRHWKQMTSGATGKWAAPVMAFEEGNGMKWTPFKNTNQDMQFNEFLEFLFNVTCAVYQIDPNEVGFKSWTSKNSGLSQSDNTAEKMDQSQDKGFVPLMNFLADTFNHEIVDQIDDEFEFAWVGVDEQDEDKKLDRQKTKLEAGVIVVAEARKADDMEELINPATGKPWLWTMAPANPQLLQVFMAEAGLGQDQQQPGDDPNDPNAEADNEQAAADDAHEKGKEMADDGHDKQLEIMDKQHEQTMEAKESDQQHQLKMEQVKAQNAAKAQQQASKDKASSEGKKADAANKAGGKQPSEDPDDAHERELDKMDKKHEHDMELEKLKQKNKGGKVNKSLTDELGNPTEGITITIEWGDY